MDHHARLAAIRIVRHLDGETGRDCADKLLAMMWEDWRLENRLAVRAFVLVAQWACVSDAMGLVT